jgi:hypothetical protein
MGAEVVGAAPGITLSKNEVLVFYFPAEIAEKDMGLIGNVPVLEINGYDLKRGPARHLCSPFF